RVPEPSGRLRLDPEPLSHAKGRRWQASELDGDLDIELEAERPPDRAHSPLSEEFDEEIAVGDDIAWGVCEWNQEWIAHGQSTPAKSNRRASAPPRGSRGKPRGRGPGEASRPRPLGLTPRTRRSPFPRGPPPRRPPRA